MKRGDSIFHIDLTGFDAIEKKLNEMPIRLRNKGLRKALTEASELVRAEAERRAPVGKVAKGWMAFLEDPDHPRLKDNIVKQVTVTRQRAWARVGIDYKKVRHGHLVEFGHELVIFGRRYGRTRKHPFMRPAFDNKAEEAVTLMGSILFDVVFGGI